MNELMKMLLKYGVKVCIDPTYPLFRNDVVILLKREPFIRRAVISNEDLKSYKGDISDLIILELKEFVNELMLED